MSTIHQSARNRTKKFHNTGVRRLQGAPHKKGIVQKVKVVSPKKPNSARRKVAKVMLTHSKLHVTAKLKGQGHNLHQYSWVLICGGRANDLPGVRYSMLKGKLDFSDKEDFMRRKRRSKFGIKIDRMREKKLIDDEEEEVYQEDE